MRIPSRSNFCQALVNRFREKGALDPAQDFKGMTPVDSVSSTGVSVVDRAKRSYRNAELEFLSSRQVSHKENSLQFGDGITLVPFEDRDQFWFHQESEQSGQSEFHQIPVSRKATQREKEMHKVLHLSENRADKLFAWVRKNGDVQVEETHISLEKPEESSFNVWILTR